MIKNKMLWLSCLLISGAILIRLDFNNRPLSFDGANYFYSVLRINSGEADYLDDGNNKPPVIYLLQYLIFKLSGSINHTVALSSLICDFFILILLVMIGRQRHSTVAGLLSAGLWGFNFLTIKLAFSGQTENPMTVFLLLGVYLFGQGSISNKRALGIGMAWALALLSKQAALLSIFTIMVYFALVKIEGMRLIFIITGFFIPILIFSIYLLSNEHLLQGIDALLLNNIYYGYEYGHSLNFKAGYLLRSSFFKFPFFIFLILWACWYGLKKQTLIILLFWVPYVAFFFTYNFYDHYLLQIMPFGALTAAWIVMSKPDGMIVRILWFCVIFQCLGVGVSWWYHRSEHLPLPHRINNPVRALLYNFMPDRLDLQAQLKVARSIKANLKPGERFISTHAVFYVLTETKSPYRFTFIAPMTAALSGDNNQGFAKAATTCKFLVTESNQLQPGLLPEKFIMQVLTKWIQKDFSNRQYLVFENPDF